MRRWAQRWWKSSESTSRGSATRSPSSAPLLLQQDKRHLSSSFPSKKRGTPASGLWCSFMTASFGPTGYCCLLLLWQYSYNHLLRCCKCNWLVLLTEHCPKLLSREPRGPERSPWVVVASLRWRRMTEAAEWRGMKMMTFQVRGMRREGRRRSKDWRTNKSQFTLCVFQYQTMVSHRPAAPCEPQRSPPWSSWWSSPFSETTNVWAWAPSPPAHLAPSRASSLGSQL